MPDAGHIKQLLIPTTKKVKNKNQGNVLSEAIALVKLYVTEFRTLQCFKVYSDVLDKKVIELKA